MSTEESLADSGPPPSAAAMRGQLYRIEWRELFPWIDLFRVFRTAIQVRLLMIAAVAVMLTLAGWWLIGWVFSGTDDEQLRAWIDAYASCPWTAPLASSPGEPAAMNLELHAGSTERTPDLGRPPADAFLGPWHELSAPVRQLFNPEMSLTAFTFVLCAALWGVAVWSCLGGVITRLAAVQLTRDERLPFLSGVRFVRARASSYFAGPLLPLLAAAFLALPVVLLGVVMRANFGLLVAGALWPVAIAFATVMAILLVGLAFGWPLMWPTISTEGTDSFDSLSRSYSYVYQRPLHYAAYALLVAVVGALGYWAVRGFASLVTDLSLWSASWGAGSERIQLILSPDGLESSVGGAGRWMLLGWLGCVRLATIAFAYSYFHVAATGVYLQLRHDVDGAETDEIFLEPSDEGPFSLPGLTRDAAGVPDLAEELAGETAAGGSSPEDGADESARRE